MNEKERDTILVGGIVILYFFWTYIISPSIKWVQQNWLTVQIIILLLITGIVIGYLYLRNESKKREIQRAKYIETQNKLGQFNFVDRNDQERWGTQAQITIWKAEDDEARVKESKLYKVTESIKKFRPSRVYRNEFGYHAELQGWLKQEFPNASFEKSTGASRPDIVIDEIAIEVKGPTGNSELGTLSEKVFKYLRHYEKLVIVLFEPSFSEERYREIKEGIEHYVPGVIFIRKDEESP